MPLSPELPNIYRLHYAQELKQNKFRAAQVDIELPGEDVGLKILQEAYLGAKRKKSLLIIISPKSGPGRAKEIYEKEAAPLFSAAGCKTTVKLTTHRNHGMEIARDMDVNEFDAIVCCSGDGIPHEVLNGLGKRADAKKVLSNMPVSQVPSGSGNSLAWSLYGSASPSVAALGIIKGIPMKADLMYFTQGNNVTLSFLSQTYGLIACADLGTENMRFLGAQRFAAGAVMRALAASSYPCEIDIKYAHQHVDQVKSHYKSAVNKVDNPLEGEIIDDEQASQTGLPAPKYGTVNDSVPSDWVHVKRNKLSTFYIGNMPYVSSDALFFPGALPNDGYMDLAIWDSTVGRIKSLEILLQIEEGKHVYSKKVEYSKVEAYRLTPAVSEGYLSIDGESFPLEPFQVEVLAGAGCFLSSTGRYVVVDF